MALPLITPALQVSPQGGGTITGNAYGTPGTIPNRTYNDSIFQNYKYVATPALGYRFVRFDIDATYTYRDSSTPQETRTAQHSEFPANEQFTSDMALNYGTTWHAASGATYWWQRYSGSTEEYLTELTVTAVFERVQPQGPKLLYDDGPNNTGLLIYDDGPNNTGLLIYGGV